ncbi:MAG TPA: hypothetical protein VKE26_04315, partial [Xanthobacteraceae bacterium]|nr:hypothetical protein [Xanthobacteraceae bacterium]
MSTKRSAYRRDGPNGWDDPDNSPDDWADVGAHMARHGGVMPGDPGHDDHGHHNGDGREAGDGHHDLTDNDDDLDEDEDEDHGANPPGVPGDPGHNGHGHHDGNGHEARHGPGEHHDLADNDDDLDEDEDEDHGANP